jgi:hypothetical protein
MNSNNHTRLASCHTRYAGDQHEVTTHTRDARSVGHNALWAFSCEFASSLSLDERWSIHFTQHTYYTLDLFSCARAKHCVDMTKLSLTITIRVGDTPFCKFRLRLCLNSTASVEFTCNQTGCLSSFTPFKSLGDVRKR